MGFETGTGNFAAGNGNFLPEVFSKKVQLAFRKSAVAEAVCNTDYMGEIASFGDTVNIIKEPQITVADYTRGQTSLTGSVLTDEELTLTIDQAKHFEFSVDDLEKRFSHVNWQQIAGDNAAYALKDAFDEDIMTEMVSGAGNAYGTTSAAKSLTTVDALDVLARLARMLDDNNVPEENRYVVASPSFYEALAKTSSKLMSVDYNQGDGGLRNGLVASGQLRGFKMYRSNNLPSQDTGQAAYCSGGTGSDQSTCETDGGTWVAEVAESDASGVVLAGHMSAVSCAQSLSTVETVRSTTSFQDIVRGLLVWGRKVLRPESLAVAYVKD